MGVIDTHAHLNDPAFANELEDVIARAVNSNVSGIIVAAYDLASSYRAVELTKQHSHLWATVGIHPHDAPQATKASIAELRSMAKDPRVVAIGEIGLDYYWNTHPKELQQQAFCQQIELASDCSLPFVVHDRDAHGDVLAILKEHSPFENGFVMHCYSGSLEFAAECVRLGGYISFAGPVTFRNASRLQEVAKAVPLERLLVETDCPYLAPHPHRGKRNEPMYVNLVAETIAHLRGSEPELIKEHTTHNAKQLFGIEETL